MIDDFEFGFGAFRIWDWGFMIEDWGRINMGKTPTPKFKISKWLFITHRRFPLLVIY